MSIFFTGVGLFLLAMIVHFVVWRIRRPRRTGHTLIALFVTVVGGGGIVAAVAAAVSDMAASLLPGNVFSWMQAAGLGLALAAAYVMTYPAIEVESPILVIVEAIARRGDKGIEAAELYRRLDEEVLVKPRLLDLVDEGLVVVEGDRYRATPRGLALAHGYTAWRQLIRAGLGG